MMMEARQTKNNEKRKSFVNWWDFHILARVEEEDEDEEENEEDDENNFPYIKLS